MDLSCLRSSFHAHQWGRWPDECAPFIVVMTSGGYIIIFSRSLCRPFFRSALLCIFWMHGFIYIELSWTRSHSNFATRRELTLFCHTQNQCQRPMVRVWASLPNAVAKTLVTRNRGTDLITSDQANINIELFSYTHSEYNNLFWSIDAYSPRLIPPKVRR